MANADDATTLLRLLQDLFARQWRSLPQYLQQSWAWAGPGDDDARAALEGIATHHTEHAQRLAELIQDRGGAVPHVAFPDRFTEANYHFVAIDYLVGELVRYQRGAIAAMEAECNGVAESEIRNTIDTVLADERQDLQLLEQLAEKHNVHLAQ